MDIAIVGSGVSGLTATWALNRDGHRVTLFEQHRTPGGHVATVTVEADGGPVPVDTGFLKNSIKGDVDRSKAVGEVAVTAEYAAYVEYGTRHMAAQPYLTPAAEHIARGLESLGAQLIKRALS